MTWIFLEHIGYHQYCSWHFVSNFKTKSKNVTLKNMLHKICTNPSKHEFDILYENLMETNNVIKAWLEVEPKKNKYYHMI